MRRDNRNNRDHRLLIVWLAVSVILSVLTVWARTEERRRENLWETSIPDAGFAVPTLGMSSPEGSEGDSGAVEKICCLTFDDGPSRNTQDILQILRDKKVHATFFVTAQPANEPYLPLLADIEAQGHQIAMHSASHNYSKIYRSTTDFWLDIKELRQQISPYVSVEKIHWLRFPGGSTNTISHRYGGRSIMQELKQDAEEKDYRWIDWNVCGEDATAGHPNAARILKNIQEDAQDQPLCVVLLHDTKATGQTVKALPDIIDWFAAQGYRFCTVEEMAE